MIVEQCFIKTGYKMLKNLFRIIYRDLSKDKTYSVISIAGLSAAISVSIVIIAISFSFLTFNRFHEKGERIYQAFCKTDYLKDGIEYNRTMSCLLGNGLKNKYPEIRNAVTVKSDEPLIFVVDNNKFEQKGIYSDESLFYVFTFPIIKQTAKSIFTDNKSVAISRSVAGKFFNSPANAMGKRIILRRSHQKKEVYVSAVFEDVPKNSSLSFDYVLPIKSLLDEHKQYNAWGYLAASTYFEVNPNVNIDALNAKIKGFIREMKPGSNEELFLYKFGDVFLNPPDGQGLNITVGISVLLIIAFIVLTVAAINFINLAISRSSKKSREIGLRKIIGADRKSLIIRFMTESYILVFIAVLLGLVFAEAIIPFVNESFNGIITFTIPYNNKYFILSIIVLWLITGLLAGFYPALYLSSLSPMAILRGFNSLTGRRNFLRKSLIVVQFTFSTFFIFITVVIIKQVNYIMTKNHGLNIRQVIEFDLTDEISKHLNTFTGDLRNNPGISEITYASDEPTWVEGSTSDPKWEGKPKEMNDMFPVVTVGDNFLNTFDIKVIKGRDFLAGDSLDTKNFIINETMAKIISKDNPVGLGMSFWRDQGQIVGVIKDYQNTSLFSSVRPLIIRKRPGEGNLCFVKVHPDNLNKTLKFIESVYGKFEKEYPFKYYFLDQRFLERHLVMQLFRGFFGLCGIIAIIVSCMGLFGLTAFSIQQKTKEVGIRKVLGASAISILMMLTKSIIKLASLGAIIGLTAGYYVSRLLLQIFVSRTDIDASLFLLVIFVVLFLASGTVIFQALRAALANPVNSLRYE
jgi:ABC-type antimicrobial peptide transport system permease subunit